MNFWLVKKYLSKLFQVRKMKKSLFRALFSACSFSKAACFSAPSLVLPSACSFFKTACFPAPSQFYLWASPSACSFSKVACFSAPSLALITTCSFLISSLYLLLQDDSDLKVAHLKAISRLIGWISFCILPELIPNLLQDVFDPDKVAFLCILPDLVLNFLQDVLDLVEVGSSCTNPQLLSPSVFSSAGSPHWSSRRSRKSSSFFSSPGSSTEVFLDRKESVGFLLSNSRGLCDTSRRRCSCWGRTHGCGQPCSPGLPGPRSEQIWTIFPNKGNLFNNITLIE